MPKLSDQQKQRNEESIRAAMDRLLRGDVPPGGRCDIKTLAIEAGVNRTAFYPKKDRHGTLRPGPYQHLAEEFERRLAALKTAGTIPDPRDDQIARLKDQVAGLKDRLAEANEVVAELEQFKKLALTRLAAQQDEIKHLREDEHNDARPATVRSLPLPRATEAIGTCS